MRPGFRTYRLRRGGHRMRARLLVLAGMLAIAACSRRTAPVMDVTPDAVDGLIEVELRDGQRLDLTGAEVLDDDLLEDPEFGDVIGTERDLELRVAPERVAEVLAQLRARPEVIWAEPVTHVE